MDGPLCVFGLLSSEGSGGLGRVGCVEVALFGGPSSDQAPSASMMRVAVHASDFLAEGMDDLPCRGSNGFLQLFLRIRILLILVL